MAQFEEFGLPRWSMLLVGAAEVAAAIGVQVALTSLLASVGLLALLAGALSFHWRAGHPPGRFAPAAVLAALCVVNLAGAWM